MPQTSADHATRHQEPSRAEGTRREEIARADWEQRIGRPSGDGHGISPAEALDPPAGLTARPGCEQVTLDWEPVEEAAGYLVHRSWAWDGPFEPVDFGGNDVLAVPHGPYTDTTGTAGRQAWYAVAAVADVTSVGPLCAPVEATPEGATPEREAGAAAPVVEVAVDAAAAGAALHRPWRPMIGSEHLSHLLSTDRTGDRPIGPELTEALRLCHRDLGVETVRAHAILGDDLGVYREVDGEAVHDFTGVDRVYDAVLALGLRPVVELSYMPRDLAVDPTKTVFAYGAVISPPRDWDRWADLVRALVAHLVERYGLDEVRDRWSFEVWNEANLEVFWSGTPQEYLRLYDVTVGAVRDVHPDLVVGGPSSAAAGWVEELLAHVEESGSPVDFVSTHTYGAPPLDLRPILARHGRIGTPIWWTEWGATPTHFNGVGDKVFAATFLLRGMRSAAGRLHALAHWVASDHFEELGRPRSLLHGGFGLLTVGNLRKPRYRALELLERLGDVELPVEVTGDGAGGMVETWAARGSGGAVGVLVWNGTLDQSKAAGHPPLDRHIRLTVEGLVFTGENEDVRYRVRHWRVDADHSNVLRTWRAMSDGALWPDAQQWQALQAADRLDELEPARDVETSGGSIELSFDLPMPGISLLEFEPL